MDRNKWLIFLGLCVAIVAGLVVFSSKDKVNVDNTNAFTIIKDKEIPDQVFGNPNAKVVLYEYGDFQCPGCAGAYANLKQLKETYKDQMAFVFRSFPLTSAHPHAFAASASAEAAGLQGKFWEMHNVIYANQDQWKNLSPEARTKTFEQYAKDLGLDMTKFKTDVSSKKVSDKINFDRALGLKLGVDSTPSLFLDNKKVADDVINDLIQQSGSKLKSNIESLIKSTGGSLPSDTPGTVEPATGQ